MKGEALGRRYAGALIESIDDDVVMDTVRSELSALSEALVMDKRTRAFFSGKSASNERKLESLRKILSHFNITPVNRRFLEVVAAHGRLDYLPAISFCFGKLVDEKRNILRTPVSVPSPMTTGQSVNLKSVLENATGMNVALEPSTDKKLIGGMVLKIAGKIYDCSLMKQLELIRERLRTAD